MHTYIYIYRCWSLLEQEKKMGFLRTQFSYSRIEEEDPEELEHRKARFLIYKVLDEADARQKRKQIWRSKLQNIKRKISSGLKKIELNFGILLAALREASAITRNLDIIIKH